MPGNFKKKDLRVIKTYNSLFKALSNLLQTRNFARLTVNDLCEEAQLSRTAFYMHFHDKYDLLKYWLESLEQEFIHKKTGPQNYELINAMILSNKKRIKNLLEGIDQISLSVVQEFIISILVFPKTNLDQTTKNNKHTVLSVFCAGGIINSLLWQINNNFPADVQVMNPYLISLLETLSLWEKNN